MPFLGFFWGLFRLRNFSLGRARTKALIFLPEQSFPFLRNLVRIELIYLPIKKILFCFNPILPKSRWN